MIILSQCFWKTPDCPKLGLTNSLNQQNYCLCTSLFKISILNDVTRKCIEIVEETLSFMIVMMLKKDILQKINSVGRQHLNYSVSNKALPCQDSWHFYIHLKLHWEKA